MTLTDEQQKLQQQIVDAKANSVMANEAYRLLRKQCVEHVYEKDGDSAVCAICGDDGGWWCPESQDHTCEYTNSDDCCTHCGNPEERK